MIVSYLYGSTPRLSQLAHFIFIVDATSLGRDYFLSEEIKDAALYFIYDCIIYMAVRHVCFDRLILFLLLMLPV